MTEVYTALTISILFGIGVYMIPSPRYYENRPRIQLNQPRR